MRTNCSAQRTANSLKRTAIGCSLLALLFALPSVVRAGSVAGVTLSTATSTSLGIQWVITSSATLGYIAEVSTASDFTGTLFSSATVNNDTTELNVSGLSPNTTYFIQVGAIDPGTTTYTAAVPAASVTLGPALTSRQFLQVSTHTLTAGWAAAGAGEALGYLLEVSTVSDFAAGVTYSSATPDLSLSTLTVNGLQSGTTYFARVTTVNWAFMSNWVAVGTSTTTVSVSSGGATGGQGNAVLAPSSISEGASISVTTVTFIVPAGGYTAGGGIKVQLPFGWGPYLQTSVPGNNGYVAALSVPSQTLIVTSSNTEASATVVLNAGQTLAAGSTIQVVISNLWSMCPSPGQTTAFWTVASLSASGGTFQNITAQPSQTFVTGSAKNIWFVPWDNMTVVNNQASGAITVAGRSSCGNSAPMAGTVVMNLNGYLNDYTTLDSNALFASDSGFSTVITSVTLSTGATQASFYYKTTTLSNNLSLRASFNDIQGGYPTYLSRSVTVLSTAVTFSGVTVDSGTAGSGSSTFTLTPDNDGVSDFAFIRFTPSDSTIQWRVRISSDGFNTWVYERWGTGNPQGSLQWDGRNNLGGAGGNSFVASGTYVVKIEIPGLTSNTSLAIAMSGASIAGKVRLGSTPMSNVWVNANATSGYGSGGAMTDANGDYTLNGLRSGQSYNLQTYFYDPGTLSSMSGSLSGITAPATGADITVSQPAKIRVSASLNQAPTLPLFGQVNAFTASYSQNYWASIRIQASSTTSDNGDSFSPSTWTVIAAQPGTYTVQLNLPGFAPATQSVTVVAGQTADVPVFAMTRPANVYGLIELPTPVVNSTWISVEGIRSGNTNPTAWGGVFLSVGQSSGVYQLFNVPTGSYSFRVRLQGYAPVLVSTTVASGDIGNMITGGLDISSTSFTTGGKILGTLTVQGDTGNQNPLTLWVNAYSPVLGSGEFTQVTLATDAVTTSGAYQISGLANGVYQVYPPYLSGFELNPPGPKSVTVTAGTGNLNLTLVQNTGQITGSITLPGGNVDYSEVSLSLMGPNVSTTSVASGATYTIPKMGSGFYDLTAVYGTTGAQVRRSVGVVNGQVSTMNLDLSAATYVVIGSVTIQSAFTLSSSSGAVTTVNTISDLLSKATTQYFYINGTQSILPTARVEAFPKRFDSYSGASRTGFSNNFFAADFKFGAIQSDGSYSISGLSPGVWELNVYPYLDGTMTPSLASTRQTLTISTASKSDIDFGLSGGYSVSGSISLPGGATDDRMFEVLIVTDRGDYVQSSSIHLGSAGNPASSMTYQFKNLPNGRYALIVADPGTWDPILMQMTRKYSAKPAAFEIADTNIPSLNITMSRASRIIGKISILGKNPDGTPSSTLITSNNTSVLPSNLRITARANPWVEGGYQEATRSSGGAGGANPQIDIDSNNQFHIDGLVPGVYDVEFRQDSYGASFVGQGSVNLAYYVKGQVVVTEGQLSDLGTIELKQGLSLTGTVQDSLGNDLPNIRVRAQASGKHDFYNNSETFTDAAGQFSLTGLNPDLKSYDVVAAPRPGTHELMAPSAYGQVTKKAIDMTQSPLPTVSFSLESANASLSGQVLTIDGGALGYPDGDQEQGYPAAAIYLQKQGAASSGDDPLGDIKAASNLDGSFSIASLVPGTYDVRIISLNYKPYKGVVTVAAGSNSLSTITLETGAALTATLLKPDGSGVNENEVRMAVAVTADLGTILFGQAAKDDNTKTVRSIRFSGFDSTKKYSVLIFDQHDNIVSPNEARNLTFSSDTEEKTLSLTYQPSAPTAFVQAKKVGSDVQVTFYFSRALRNTLPADNDMASLLTVVSGNGSLSSFAINGDRRSLSVLYTPLVDELNATLRLSGSTAETDSTTGLPFTVTKSVILRFGQRAAAEQNINPVLGGEVTLAESAGDPSGVSLPANALLGSDGSTAEADASYGISFSATEDAADLVTAAPGFHSAARGARAAALAPQLARGEAAYIPEAFQAMKAAHASATINPLSSFYSVLLPAGLSHTLQETATLTLQYDSGSDPNAINIYYFDGSKYLLESTNRTIDTVNRTITVSVSHFSTFVVLENSLPVVITDGDAGSAADLQAFNFPNPFDLSAKTKTLNHGGSTSTMDTTGTIIRYLIPSGKSGAATLEIYNVAGDKVRAISLGSPAADTYHYVSWDGKNDSGNNVASGVYVGMLKVGGAKKTWKMAVIK